MRGGILRSTASGGKELSKWGVGEGSGEGRGVAPPSSVYWKRLDT